MLAEVFTKKTNEVFTALFDAAQQTAERCINYGQAWVQLLKDSVFGSIRVLGNNAVAVSFTIVVIIMVYIHRHKGKVHVDRVATPVASPDMTGDHQRLKDVTTPYTPHYPYSWNVFDLAKTAYEPGHKEACMKLIERLYYNVNSEIPSNGLTLFLCACLSGDKELIMFMLKRGADVRHTTNVGDTALYLATFGVLSSSHPDVSVLQEIICSGCPVNGANLAGYTALHRAAGHGNLHVIQTLMKYGADPCKASASGIYPMDSAINAGHLEAAKLLEIPMPNPHVWDIVDHHTPPHISLGLQSPQRKHLIESTRRMMSPRVM